MKEGREGWKGEWGQLAGGRKRATATAGHRSDKAGATCGSSKACSE